MTLCVGTERMMIIFARKLLEGKGYAIRSDDHPHLRDAVAERGDRRE